MPIVPVVFWNTEDCFENHRPFMKAADVRIRIGTPVRIEELDKEQRRQIAQYMQDIMQGMLDGIAEEIRES